MDEYELQAAEEKRLGGYDLIAAFREHPGQPISTTDIEAVEKEWTDGTDEPEFCWLLKLKDGRYAVGDGGHDYTGWDCQSHLSVTVWPTRDEAIRMGMTVNDREHLGLLLPGESMAEPKSEEPA